MPSRLTLGALFEGSIDKAERHALGAHFTGEADILKVLGPTISRPWRECIEAAETLNDFKALLTDLRFFSVLDPACGAGDFLYYALRELLRLETGLLARLYARFGPTAMPAMGPAMQAHAERLHGIDINPVAVELARLTVRLAAKLGLDEAREFFKARGMELCAPAESPDSDNLDVNIVCNDALFCEWPRVRAIIGNPPFLGGNRIRQELGNAYVDTLFRLYEGRLPAFADLCVYKNHAR